jgi:ATP-binding protein involved in chromosome partitioning
MTEPTPARIADILRQVRGADGSTILDHAALDTTMLRDGTLHVALATDRAAAGHPVPAARRPNRHCWHCPAWSPPASS